MSALIEGEGLLLTGADLLVIAGLVERGLKYMRSRDALGLGPSEIVIVRALKQAAALHRARMASQLRRDDVTPEPPEAGSAESSEITVREAAEILDLSIRQTYRHLQTDLASAVVRDHPLLLDSSLVSAYKLIRPEKRTAA